MIISPSTSLSIVTATKIDKSAIKRFYKQQHYPARFMGLDHCYYITHQGLIIAAVIVSYITNDNPQAFLHALVVDKAQQHRSLATKLLSFIQGKHQLVVCFAHQSLSPLYHAGGFKCITPELINPNLLARFKKYSQHKPDLKVFINDTNNVKTVSH